MNTFTEFVKYVVVPTITATCYSYEHNGEAIGIMFESEKFDLVCLTTDSYSESLSVQIMQSDKVEVVYAQWLARHDLPEEPMNHVEISDAVRDHLRKNFTEYVKVILKDELEELLQALNHKDGDILRLVTKEDIIEACKGL